MLLSRATVLQDVLVVTARVFKGVREDGHSVKSTVVVDGLGEGDDGRSEPSWVDEDRTKGIAEKVTEKVAIEFT